MIRRAAAPVRRARRVGLARAPARRGGRRRAQAARGASSASGASSTGSAAARPRRSSRRARGPQDGGGPGAAGPQRARGEAHERGARGRARARGRRDAAHGPAPEPRRPARRVLRTAPRARSARSRSCSIFLAPGGELFDWIVARGGGMSEQQAAAGSPRPPRAGSSTFTRAGQKSSLLASPPRRDRAGAHRARARLVGDMKLRPGLRPPARGAPALEAVHSDVSPSRQRPAADRPPLRRKRRRGARRDARDARRQDRATSARRGATTSRATGASRRTRRPRRRRARSPCSSCRCSRSAPTTAHCSLGAQLVSPRRFPVARESRTVYAALLRGRGGARARLSRVARRCATSRAISPVDM